jgi:hypothetical protein
MKSVWEQKQAAVKTGRTKRSGDLSGEQKHEATCQLERETDDQRCGKQEPAKNSRAGIKNGNKNLLPRRPRF